MQISLLDTIWLSEKRKKIIQYLKEEPLSIDAIKLFLDVPTRSIIPEIKKLKGKEIIIEENGFYRLSNIGELIAKKMEVLLSTEKMIEINKEYWQNNDLDQIPSHLYKRLWELNNYTFHEYEVEDLVEPPLELMVNLKEAEYVMALMPFFIPHYPLYIIDLLENGKRVTLILPLPIFEKLKVEYPIEMKKLLNSNEADIFICNEGVKGPMVTVSDNYALIGFFKKDGIYGSKELISFDKSVIKWTNDLFVHYMLSSKNTNEA